MARIVEDLFLVLTDNPAATPALAPQRVQRLLAAGVLLDLALACRIRPALAADPARPGELIALAGGAPPDRVSAPAYDLLSRSPLGPQAAVARLRTRTLPTVAAELVRAGEVRQERIPGTRLRPAHRWPVADRARVDAARAHLAATLFDRRSPTPVTAALVTLLHAADGLGALFSLNDRGWRWVHARATEIAGGAWVRESPATAADLNLAATAAALRPAVR